MAPDRFVSVISAKPYHSLVAKVQLLHIKKCERQISHSSENFAQNFASLIVAALNFSTLNPSEV